MNPLASSLNYNCVLCFYVLHKKW
ncbi:rCG63225 [Rattus norvegicus]|uniref:RCG63225 n=1 Tax=Rattus norvegicus TaxID=10116 RepID=A6IYG1_RAT|nr:rCG63225 [Rattus norvegicus]